VSSAALDFLAPCVNTPVQEVSLKRLMTRLRNKSGLLQAPKHERPGL
jgi:hypothetical protein